jgi:hypothetical protein
MRPGASHERSNEQSYDGELSLTEGVRALLFAKGQTPQPIRERRATPRVRAEVVCMERTHGTRYLRTTYDLSTFGLATQYGHVHEVGEEVRLTLHLPDNPSRPLEVRARVVGHLRDRTGMRLAFLRPSRETVRRIHRFLFSQAVGAS